MKSSRARTASATSLPRAPQEEASSRVRRYLITMAIRTACLVLMVLVTPYSWYTWVFAAGAIFLPYFAVVLANVAQASTSPGAESPELALPETPTPREPEADPEVIQIFETAQDPGSGASAERAEASGSSGPTVSPSAGDSEPSSSAAEPASAADAGQQPDPEERDGDR